MITIGLRAVLIYLLKNKNKNKNIWDYSYLSILTYTNFLFVLEPDSPLKGSLRKLDYV